MTQLPRDDAEDKFLVAGMNRPSSDPEIIPLPKPPPDESLPDAASTGAIPPPLPRSWQEGEQWANSIVGPFDAYLARVKETFYNSLAPPLGRTQAVKVERCFVEYGTNNEPLARATVPVQTQNTSGIGYALPFPPAHDQEDHHVVAGDIVTVVEGRDDKLYYFLDNDSFVGYIVDNTEEGDQSEVKEDFTGGAGNLSLVVRRRVISGDTTAATWAGPPLNVDVKDTGGTEITYRGVKPVMPSGVQHGYRVGDLVLVTRRGQYFFCQPSRQGFVAEIVATGPDAETEPTDNGYYVREQDWTIAYTNEKATYTFSQADRTAAVAGMSGTNGRHVLAYNLALDAVHDLPTDGSISVWVNMIRDPATGEPGYAFNLNPQQMYWGKAQSESLEDALGWEVSVKRVDDVFGNGGDVATIKVYFEELRGSHEAPNVRTGQVVGYVFSGGRRFCVVGQRWDLPIGGIRLWHSTTIPDGYQEADGTNGTTDWTDASVRISNMAADDYGGTTGSDTSKPDDHASHTHSLAAGAEIAAGTDASCTTTGPSATLTHSTQVNIPASVKAFMIERID